MTAKQEHFALNTLSTTTVRKLLSGLGIARKTRQIRLVGC